MRLRIGNGEFGEIYHAACAYRLDESVTVEFENVTIGQEFFDTFVARGEPRPPQQEEPTHVGETANIIRDRYHEGCLRPIADAIAEFARENRWTLPQRFEHLINNDPKVLIWHRNKQYKPHRNSGPALIRQIAQLCRKHNTLPILIGSHLHDHDCYELGEFWRDEFFNEHSIAKQLWCIDRLFECGGTVASVGVMSGTMDGVAMVYGHKTVFLARHSDATPRMQKVTAGVPNLIWQQIEFTGNLVNLNDSDLSAVERLIWC